MRTTKTKKSHKKTKTTSDFAFKTKQTPECLPLQETFLPSLGYSYRINCLLFVLILIQVLLMLVAGVHNEIIAMLL